VDKYESMCDYIIMRERELPAGASTLLGDGFIDPALYGEPSIHVLLYGPGVGGPHEDAIPILLGDGELTVDLSRYEDQPTPRPQWLDDLRKSTEIRAKTANAAALAGLLLLLYGNVIYGSARCPIESTDVEGYSRCLRALSSAASLIGDGRLLVAAGIGLNIYNISEILAHGIAGRLVHDPRRARHEKQRPRHRKD
jgi:hypothetical protein